MRIYLSGKITDNPEYKEMFKDAEEEIKKEYKNAAIVNPAKLAEIFPNGTWEEYMKICRKMLDLCDSIYMLSNYKDSAGACYELGYATARDMTVIFQ